MPSTQMGPGREVSRRDRRQHRGGSRRWAGAPAIERVADDQLGRCSRDIRAAGVAFKLRASVSRPRRYLIFVERQDGQRTMNTYLGASQFLPERSTCR